MNKRDEWHCWEIMHCEDSEDCLAKKNPKTPCWEFVRHEEDYRGFFNICQDCIVYVLKQDSNLISQKQKENILVKKRECVLAA